MKGLLIVSMCSSDSSQRNHSYRQTDQYQVLHNSLNFVNQELSFSLLFCSVFTAIYVEDMHNYLHFRFAFTCVENQDEHEFPLVSLLSFYSIICNVSTYINDL